MIQSSRTDFNAKYIDLFEMSWLIRGPAEDDVDTHYKRWIIFSELENCISGDLTSMMITALNHADDGTAENNLLIAFKSYFASKLDYTIYPLDGSNHTNPHRDGVYPDKQPIHWENDLGAGTLDLKKARMSPYIARLAMRYMNLDSDFFQWTSMLTDLTATGKWEFLDQSPDTRDYTFQAAVVCESESVCKTENTQFLINEIPTDNINFFCSSTELSYPLYGGECRYHKYWNALK